MHHTSTLNNVEIHFKSAPATASRRCCHDGGSMRPGTRGPPTGAGLRLPQPPVSVIDQAGLALVPRPSPAPPDATLAAGVALSSRKRLRPAWPHPQPGIEAVRCERLVSRRALLYTSITVLILIHTNLKSILVYIHIKTHPLLAACRQHQQTILSTASFQDSTAWALSTGFWQCKRFAASLK